MAAFGILCVFWSDVTHWFLSVLTEDGQIIEPKMSASFVPDHKASMVLFLDRVYGIDNQDFLLHVLEVGFLPDMRAAAALDTVSRQRPRWQIYSSTVRVNSQESGSIMMMYFADPDVSSRNDLHSVSVQSFYSSFTVSLSGYSWHSAQLKWPWHWTVTCAQLFCLWSPSVPRCLPAQITVPSWLTPCSTPSIVCPVAEPSPRLRGMSSRSASCHSASQSQLRPLFLKLNAYWLSEW